MAEYKTVFKLDEAELLESPDGMMRDTMLITDASCGTETMSAGLVWVHPKERYTRTPTSSMRCIT